MQPTRKFKRILLSAGPMRTALDPARSIQNRSSGKMGLALARAAAKAGNEVTVLLGPVEAAMRQAFSEFRVLPYESAADYGRHLDLAFPEHDVFISAAAVLDFSVQYSTEKKDRRTLFGTAEFAELPLSISRVPDFVQKMASLKRPDQWVVAFAAEASEQESALRRARGKLIEKGADALFMNRIAENTGPEAATNELWFLLPDSRTIHLGSADKEEMGQRAWRVLEEEVLFPPKA